MSPTASATVATPLDVECIRARVRENLQKPRSGIGGEGVDIGTPLVGEIGLANEDEP